MATTVLGLKTFTASDPVDYNEVNDNYVKIDNGVKTAMQGRAVYNLLDNSDFRNPVNQRGASSYKGSTYSFDRWYFYSSDATDSQVYKRDGNIGLKSGTSPASITQRFPKGYLDSSKSYTLAYYDNINDRMTVKSNPVVFSRDDFDYVSISVTTGVATFIQWAAMYEGSYTADTLPAYVPKGYVAELAECQMYYQSIPFDFSMYNVAVDSSYPSRYQITLPQEMRIAPTVSFAESWNSNVKSYTSSYVSKKALAFTVSANSNGYTEWHGSVALSADL